MFETITKSRACRFTQHHAADGRFVRWITEAMATDPDFRDGLGSAFGGGDSAFDVYASAQHGYSLPLSCCDTAPLSLAYRIFPNRSWQVDRWKLVVNRHDSDIS